MGFSVRCAVFGAALAACAPASAETDPGSLPPGWTGEGHTGSGSADGSVSAAPHGSGTYTYVSTAGGVNGKGYLPGVGGSGRPVNGSVLTTDLFSAEPGDTLNFHFNYVTSDGAGYADYAWARLLTAPAGEEVAILFTARTTSSGETVPGLDMPDPVAELTPPSVIIYANETEWSALLESSEKCWAWGCGSTGWVETEYEINDAGDYQLQFGVTNWKDRYYDSGMAVAGAVIAGESLGEPVVVAPVSIPPSWLLFASALSGLVYLGRVKSRGSASAPHWHEPIRTAPHDNP